jgi:hypothetical protein
MSIIKLELKNEHLKLLKHIKWGEYDVETNTLKTSEAESPFGGDNLYEDAGLILYGIPDNFSPLDDSMIEYTDEQKENIDKLMSELPLALEIILNNGTVDLGLYKTKWHDRVWKKLNK